MLPPKADLLEVRDYNAWLQQAKLNFNHPTYQKWPVSSAYICHAHP
jgi:hypothetical protein